jgi:catechol 2,3-dioxygenase-like lactoylglutathione lyase family enzyme
MAKALRHVGIVVSDLEKTLKIFLEYLDCKLVSRSRDIKGEYLNSLVGLDNVLLHVAIVRTEDNSRIELLEYVSHRQQKKQNVKSNSIGVSHLALTVRNLRELFDNQSEFEVRFLTSPLRSPDGFVKVAYVVVREECLLELVEVLDSRAELSGGDVEEK